MRSEIRLKLFFKVRLRYITLIDSLFQSFRVSQEVCLSVFFKPHCQQFLITPGKKRMILFLKEALHFSLKKPIKVLSTKSTRPHLNKHAYTKCLGFVRCFNVFNVSYAHYYLIKNSNLVNYYYNLKLLLL